MSSIDEIKGNISTSNEIAEIETEFSKMTRKQKKSKLDEKSKQLWTEVGWHRPLAGFWFNYILLLVIALPGLLVLGILLPRYILPFPEALGYNAIIVSYMSPIFLFADFGIKEAIEKFIAQHAETKPHRALRYISFFIWYQAITGLLQVTLISYMALTIIPKTDISYAGWFFMVYIMIQWPGTPGVFKSALGGFQQFDKQAVIVVIQNVAIQTLTQVGFIYLGRWIGNVNPSIGELMGATMGFIVGSYADDIIAVVIGAKMFAGVLKPYGIRLRETLFITFDKELVKEVMIYGGKVLPSGLSYAGVNALITIMLSQWLWNYPTWMGIYTIASGLVGALGVSFSNLAPISEAYNNGKKELTLFYIRSQFQWWGILSIGVLMSPLLFLIPYILGNVALEYADAQWMVFPLFLGAFILFPSGFSGTVCQACNLPEHSTYMNFIEQGTRLITYLLVLAPWGVTKWFGPMWVIYLWLFAEAPGYAFKGIYGWWIVRKKLFPNHPIKFPLYKTLIAPSATLIVFVPLSFIMRWGFKVVYASNEIAGYGLAAVYLLALLYIFPIFIFMPLYGWLGGFDKQNLIDFQKSAIMAGPSRKITTWLYKAGKFGYERSPWKDKFNEIPSELAMKEALEITMERHQLEQKK